MMNSESLRLSSVLCSPFETTSLLVLSTLAATKRTITILLSFYRD